MISYDCYNNVRKILSPAPSLQTAALGDGDVSEDVPRVGLEEMLQEMTITDSSHPQREEGAIADNSHPQREEGAITDSSHPQREEGAITDSSHPQREEMTGSN